jgi:hypothetical protein
MIQILQKRISDQRFLRIIRKLMKAGVMVNGEAVGRAETSANLRTEVRHTERRLAFPRERMRVL